MFRKKSSLVKTISETGETSNKICKEEKSDAKDLHSYGFRAVKKNVSINNIANNTTAYASSKTPGRSITKEYENRRLHDFKNGKTCPDCGKNWNPHITHSQLEFLLLKSPPQITPEHQPSTRYYREPVPSPPKCNQNINNSNSDNESSSDFESSVFADFSSELGGSCESLPPINWSFTNDCM